MTMRIAMYAGALRQWGKLYPNALFDDVPSPAGTEIAMMGVANQLARLGHRVSVFADCEPGTYDGVDYMKTDLALPILGTIEHDVVVSWQDSAIFLYPIKARLKVLMSQSSNLGVGQVGENIDRYFGISRFSASLLLENEPYADPSRMWITRNGVMLQRFAFHDTHERNYHRMVWASSPDRGLNHLLPIFTKVREQVPDAELVVCYDFDKAFSSYKQNQPGSAFVRHLETAAELKKLEGVTFLQHVSQPRMAEILMGAGVFTYTCDPIRPTETYCNAITEAMAAGLPVVTTSADCLDENYRSHSCMLDRPIDHDLFAQVVVQLMTDKKMWQSQSKKSRELAEMCSYTEVAGEWEQLFTDFLLGEELICDFSLAARKERFR